MEEADYEDNEYVGKMTKKKEEENKKIETLVARGIDKKLKEVNENSGKVSTRS